MDDLVWCCSCGQSASLAQAVAELPCRCCGGKNYFVAVSSAGEDALLSLSERMQRVGDWEVAEAAFRRCFESGFISAADYHLSLHQLEFRKECADSAVKMIRSSSSALTVSELKSSLENDFDQYTVSWLMSDFSGIRLVPFGSTYIVEVADG